jgi:hypothetical protein
MLTPDSIEGGKFYHGKNGWFRQILQDDGADVYWQMFGNDGHNLGTGYCSKKHLSSWADREATVGEVALLPHVAVAEQRMSEFKRMVRAYIGAASDDDILAEARRRNLIL